MAKNILLLTGMILFLSLSTAKTNLYTNVDIKASKYCKLDIRDDSWNLYEDICTHLNEIGFEVIDQQSDTTADYIIEVDYKTYWDVFYQTFRYYNMEIKEAKTGETLVDSKYIGRFGFNSCRRALKKVFKDLKKKLSKDQ